MKAKRAAAGKQGRADGGASVGVPSASAPGRPAEATGGVAALTTPRPPAPAPDAQPHNARRAAPDGGSAKAGGGKRAKDAQASTGERGQGRTRGKAGGRPKCGSPTATLGAETLSTDNPDQYPLFPDDIPVSSADTPPPSFDMPPLSGEILPPAVEKMTAININIHSAEPIPYDIPPGAAETQPKLGRMTGRDHTGKVIPHQRDEKIAAQIARWVAIGAGENEIALYLNIRPGVLRKCYKQELETGQFANNMAVGEKILEMAKSGENERMTLLWAKARMGWRESDKADTNGDGILNIHIHS